MSKRPIFNVKIIAIGSILPNLHLGMSRFRSAPFRSCGTAPTIGAVPWSGSWSGSKTVPLHKIEMFHRKILENYGVTNIHLVKNE